MAMAFERFSIRGYVGEMRGVELGKCWPFAGDARESSLPPIPAPRFRRWSDELEAARSAEPAAEISTEEPLDDRYVSPSKAKQRAPKKRSIRELFAVSPAIEAADDDSADGGKPEREPEGSESPAKGKEMVMMRKKMMKIKKKKRKVDEFPEIKGKAWKSKMPSSINISHILQDLVHKRWSGNPVDNQKKLKAIKCPQKNHKFKPVQLSELVTKTRQEITKLHPVGILKDQAKKNTFSKKANTLVNPHRGNLLKRCSKSPKRVSFSEKDTIFGHENSCSSVKLSQLKSLCKKISDVLAASSDMGNSSKNDTLATGAEGSQMFSLRGKEAVASAVKQSDGFLSQKEQPTSSDSQVIPPTPMSPTVAETSTTGNLDLNMQSNIDLNSLNLSDSTLPSSPKDSGDLKIQNFIRNNELSSDAAIHVDYSFQRATDVVASLPPSGKFISGTDTVRSLTVTSTPISECSPSCCTVNLDTNGSQPHPSLGFKPNHLTQDLMSSLCSSAGSKRFEEPSLSGPWIICRDKCAFEDFIGLPLNSQGELIKLDSGKNFSFIELYKKQNTVLSPNHGFSVPTYVEPNNRVGHVAIEGRFPTPAFYPSGERNWFAEQYYPSGNLVTSGLGFSDLQNIERMRTQNHVSGSYDTRYIPIEASCRGYREDNQTDSCIDRVKFQAEGNLNCEFLPTTQPTMRLMGKNVTIGKSNKECQYFDDGNIWTDKEIVSENCSSVRMSDKILPKQWPQQQLVPTGTPACGNSKVYQPQPSEAHSSFYHMPPILPRYDNTHFDCRFQWTLRNGINSTFEDHGFNVDSVRHPVPIQTALNKTSKSIANTVSGIEFVNMRDQIQVSASHNQNVYQPMLLNSKHCKHTQDVFYNTLSVPRPAFSYGDHPRFSQTPLGSAPSTLPQWLLRAECQRKTQEISPSLNAFAVHQPPAISRTDPFPLAPVPPTFTIPFPVYSSSTSHICGSFTPVSGVHPSFNPAFAANIPGSEAKGVSRDKNKNINGTKPKSAFFQGQDHAGPSMKTLKRPLAKDDDFMKPAKMRCVKPQKDSTTPTCPERVEQSHGYTHQNLAALEPQVHGNKRTDGGVAVVHNKCGGFKSSSESCSLKVVAGSRMGPIKLTAGAKHILKPNLTIAQECPRPIHSTIPFSIEANSSRSLVSQHKTTNIYKF